MTLSLECDVQFAGVYKTLTEHVHALYSYSANVTACVLSVNFCCIAIHFNYLNTFSLELLLIHSNQVDTILFYDNLYTCLLYTSDAADE